MDFISGAHCLVLLSLNADDPKTALKKYLNSIPYLFQEVGVPDLDQLSQLSAFLKGGTNQIICRCNGKTVEVIPSVAPPAPSSNSQ
jgi:hypothetical protein